MTPSASKRAERRRVALGADTRPAITVDQGCGLWWEAKGRHMRSADTMDYQMAALIKGLGANTLLGDLTLRTFDRYVARRRDGRSNASVNREIQLARRVWRWLDDRGHDVAPILWGRLMLSEPKERVRELTGEEEARLFAAAVRKPQAGGGVRAALGPAQGRGDRGCCGRTST